MNYIQRLKIQNEAQHREIMAIKDRLNGLRIYMNSPKFHSGNELDNYVNIRDVLAYLEEAESAGIRAQTEDVEAHSDCGDIETF